MHDQGRAGAPVVAGLAVAVAAAAVVAWVGLARLGPPAVEEPAVVTPQDPSAVYDPVWAGEPTPEGYRRLLRRDAIRPIYDPVTVDAHEIGWDDDTLVIGVAVEGEARAYPVRTLNRREIVNDRLGGTPILATW